jgi:hypothetical protein
MLFFTDATKSKKTAVVVVAKAVKVQVDADGKAFSPGSIVAIAAEAEVSVGFAISEVVPAEVQGGVDEAQRGWEEKEGGGIGSRGRGGVLGASNDNGWGLNDRAQRMPPRRASERGVRSRPPSPSTTMTTTQQSNSSREREGGGRWYGNGWRRRGTMVVVAIAPGLCWDNELGGRSLVSAIVSPAIDHDNIDLLNQHSTNNGGKRRRWW